MLLDHVRKMKTIFYCGKQLFYENKQNIPRVFSCQYLKAWAASERWGETKMWILFDLLRDQRDKHYRDKSGEKCSPCYLLYGYSYALVTC